MDKIQKRQMREIINNFFINAVTYLGFNLKCLYRHTLYWQYEVILKIINSQITKAHNYLIFILVLAFQDIFCYLAGGATYLMLGVLVLLSVKSYN